MYNYNGNTVIVLPLHRIHNCIYTLQIQCILYIVHCIMYTVQCNIHYTLYRLQSRVLCKNIYLQDQTCQTQKDHKSQQSYRSLESENLLLYSVQCTMYTVHCTIYLLYSYRISVQRHNKSYK